MKDKTAVVGIGATPYFKRGQSLPRTELSMACDAIMMALEDAGLTIKDLDGFSIYSNSCSPSHIAATLGIPEIKWATSTTSGGGGSVGALGVASAAIISGQANVIVNLMTLQQVGAKRLGRTNEDDSASVAGSSAGGASAYGATGAYSPNEAFFAASGIIAPGHSFSMLTKRHMHLYGTKREHLAEICISQRANAIKRPTSIRREPLTMDEYFNARMISDPFCLYDYTMESDGAVACIVTSAERARDLKQTPAYIMACAHGGMGRWGPAIGEYFQMPDEYFASSGHRPIAKRLYEQAGIGPNDIDVAELYDHFSGLVLLQVEDYGFCPIGEGGRFIEDGNIRYGGKIPVNTHGGNLSEAYIIGMTHIREAVEQLRGVATSQVPDAEIALVTGGPAGLPVSGMILRK